MAPESENLGSSPSVTNTDDLSRPLSSSSEENSPTEQVSPAQPKRSHKKKAVGPKFKSKPKSSAARPSSSASSGEPGPSQPNGPKSTPESTRGKFLGKGKGTLDAKDKKAIADSIAKGLQVGTAMGANLVVKDQMERDNSLFIANEDEAKGIAKPIVSILDRRGIGAGAGDSDTADLFEIAMGCLIYIKRNMALRKQIREYKAANAGTQTQSGGEPETVVRSTEGAQTAEQGTQSDPNAGQNTVNEPSVGSKVLEGLNTLGLG